MILLFQNERVCSGNGFSTKKENQADFCNDFETAIRNQNLNIIGWRDVPDVSNLGQIEKRTDNKTSVYW
jgi:glutamate synthase domain-containing protein 1